MSVVATLTGQAQAALTFDLTLAGDDSAGRDPAENADYTANAARGTIAAGAASGSQTTLATIQLNNDTADEAVESVRRHGHRHRRGRRRGRHHVRHHRRRERPAALDLDRRRHGRGEREQRERAGVAELRRR